MRSYTRTEYPPHVTIHLISQWMLFVSLREPDLEALQNVLTVARVLLSHTLTFNLSCIFDVLSGSGMCLHKHSCRRPVQGR
jgi:hypothetical protein